MSTAIALQAAKGVRKLSVTETGKAALQIGGGIAVGYGVYILTRSAINKVRIENVKQQSAIPGSTASKAKAYMDAIGTFFDDEAKILEITQSVKSVNEFNKIITDYNILTRTFFNPSGGNLVPDIIGALDTAQQKTQFQFELANKPQRA